MIFKRIVLFLVLSLLLCETSFLYEDYENLINIGSKFEIMIDVTIPEEEVAKKIRLNRERLRTVIELRLRKEGITIISQKSLEFPVVFIKIVIAGPAYNIDLAICEEVTLNRPSPSFKFIVATVWGHEIIGIHGGHSEEIVSSLNKLLDIFLNDYYKANPKENKKGGR